MQTISIHDIVISDNRIRKEFNEKKVLDLARSIEDKGLFHPIVLENDRRTLACGERRMRALTLLAGEGKGYHCNNEYVLPGNVVFTILAELDPIKRLEVELEENVLRQDLSIQEYSKAVAELHKLRLQQHGAYDKNNKEGWNATRTAQEIRGDKTNKRDTSEVFDALLIADNLDDPFVAAAKNKSEAMRAIKDRKKIEHRNKRTKEFDASKTEHRLILADSLNYQLVNDNTFDIIITDPPYGMELHTTSMFDNEVHDYDDSDEMFKKILEHFPDIAHNTTKPQAHCYVFCDPGRFTELFTAFELAGWECWPRPLIWHKGNIGSYGAGEYGFRQTYDAILFANKGRKPLNSVYDEVIHINQPTNHAHPAGKPWELYHELLQRSSVPGDRVIDFFCGSGPIFPAASKAKCVATGIEINEKYYQMAQATLMDIKK